MSQSYGLYRSIVALLLGAVVVGQFVQAAIIPPPAVKPVEREVALLAWGKVLSTYVDGQGRLDFISIAKDRADLDTFVAFLASTSPMTHPDQYSPDQALAYHLNAYNAWALYGVLESNFPKDFSSFFKRLKFFKNTRFQMGGKPLSLYNYENDVIRPLSEPRIHFALNCMVRSCPRLPQVVFRAETIDEQLQAAAVEFFASPQHLKLDVENKTVHVSEILKFYTKDFASSRQALIGYINKYVAVPIPTDYRVKFIPYDWTLNQSPPNSD